MTIRYSLWKTLTVIVLCGPFGLFWLMLFLSGFFLPDFDWLERLIYLVFNGVFALVALLPAIHFGISLFQGRIVFRFDETAVTRYYGLFRNKRLVIPYDLIETIGRRNKTLSQEFSEEYGNSANRIFKNTLKVAQVVNNESHLSAGSVMESTYAYFYLVFKEGNQAVSYAKQFGYRGKGKLETIQNTRIVDFRIIFVTKFSTVEIIDYMKKIRSKDD